MVHHLFPNFLHDSAEYRRAEEYWEVLCRDVIQQCSGANDWVPWLTTRLADGSIPEPGNPIYHLRSPSLRKGLRIIQVRPTSDENVVSSWVSAAGDDLPGSMAIQELVVHCELSEEAAVEVRQLLIDWVKLG
jgi:hypothetical protein